MVPSPLWLVQPLLLAKTPLLPCDAFPFLSFLYKSIPAAHGGFLQRARAINIEQLHQLAASSGRRLVLCGHSLGGAVAKISTLRLLRDLPEWPAPRVKCICFATPAIGNAALADLVKSAGWASYFRTYFLPGEECEECDGLIARKLPSRCLSLRTEQH